MSATRTISVVVVDPDRRRSCRPDALHPVAGEPGLWTGWASDLGIRPGRWPALITAATETGEVHDFAIRRFELDADGDCTAAIYTTPHGTTVLRLYND